MGERLAGCRARRGLDRSQLAAALGISVQTVASMEEGRYEPSLRLATAVARYFRVGIEDVFPPEPEDVRRTTATFVMTDIVGSTFLARSLGATYVDVLERHRELLVEAFTAHGGRVVDDTGDACFGVFELPADALRAAAAGRSAVTDEAWPGSLSLRIRIGVHTGEAYEVGNRFVGVAVHETSRICAAASGDQILVSERTAADAAMRSCASMRCDLAGLGPRLLYVA